MDKVVTALKYDGKIARITESTVIHVTRVLGMAA